MHIEKVYKDNYEKVINQAVTVIKNGGLIIYPTETFYGIGARYDNEYAMKRIYEIKTRDDNKTMPLIVSSINQLSMLVISISELETRLINHFWPGPLTILMEAKQGLLQHIVFNGKIAVRMPANDIALEISRRSNLPITSTSANISTLPPTNDVNTLIDYFYDKVDMIIDAGLTKGGHPSTIVELVDEKVRIVREGAIDKEALIKVGFMVC